MAIDRACCGKSRYGDRATEWSDRGNRRSTRQGIAAIIHSMSRLAFRLVLATDHCKDAEQM